MSRNSGSAYGKVTRIGVTWEIEVNWSVSEVFDETEIDTAWLLRYEVGKTLKVLETPIEIALSELSSDEYDELMVFANEDRCDGYDDFDADRAYDNWKADQL